METAKNSRGGARCRAYLAALVVAIVSTIALPSLSPAETGATESVVNTTATPDREPIVVLAASSMADVLPRIAQQWQDASARQVEISFAASSRLARQVLDGAPGDVYVSANSRWMQHLVDRGAVVAGTRRAFLSNELVWVVPSKAGRAAATALPPTAAGVDPASVERLALAGESVPAGIYADRALRATGLAERLDGRIVRADTVRAALEWVARGEVDAGVVYRTDALAERAVEVAFAFEPSTHPPIIYEAAVLASSERPEAASAFIDSLHTEHARGVFERAGFSELTAQDRLTAPDGHSDATQIETAPPIRDAAPTVDVWSAIRLSLLVGLGCALLGLLPAIGLGWLLARREFWGKSIVSTLVLAPLALPPVVTGFLLLRGFGRQGVLGGFLTSWGLEIPFSMAGALIAAFVVGLPMYVLSARNAFEAVDAEFEEVSLTMGYAPIETFFRVTLPLSAPGLAAGAVLMFARAIGEFGATAVLAGNFEGETRTIALAVYTLLEAPNGGQAIRVLVIASLVLSFLAMLGFERLSRWQRGRGEACDGQ